MQLDFTGTKLCVFNNKFSELQLYLKKDKVWEKQKINCKLNPAKIVWAKPCFRNVIAFSDSKNYLVSIWDEKLQNELSNFGIGEGRKILDMQFGVQEISPELAVCLDHGEIRIYKPKNEIDLNDWYFFHKRCEKECEKSY